MQVELGTVGLENSWQDTFPETTDCVHCGAESRIAFTAFECHSGNARSIFDDGLVCDLHRNHCDGKLWLHDAGAFATYLCTKCLEPTTLYNQA